MTEDGGQFIFRLVGPGLGAEAWDDTGSNTNFQYNNMACWPNCSELTVSKESEAVGAAMIGKG